MTSTDTPKRREDYPDSIRIHRDLRPRLVTEAKRRDRSIAYMINEALERALSRWEAEKNL